MLQVWAKQLVTASYLLAGDVETAQRYYSQAERLLDETHPCQ